MRAFFSFVSVLAGVLALSGLGGGVAGAQERRPYVRPEPARFDVEVLVGGRPLERLYGRGRTYVEAFEGAEYELRIRNPLPVRVAVALSVDGLNTIDARRTSSRDASKWVIEPYGSVTIGGWQVSRDRARRFYFTTERDSYAARLGRASDLGLISAAFYREDAPHAITRRTRPYPVEEDRANERGETRAENAPAPRGSAGAAKQRSQPGTVTAEPSWRDDEYAATGIGRSVGNHVYRMEMRLEPSPAAQVSIRYEYRPALVRLGLLPRTPPPPPYDPLRRRERARGFEDQQFSPEPF
jgi:hypothetical protein